MKERLRNFVRGFYDKTRQCLSRAKRGLERLLARLRGWRNRDRLVAPRRVLARLAGRWEPRQALRWMAAAALVALLGTATWAARARLAGHAGGAASRRASAVARVTPEPTVAPTPEPAPGPPRWRWPLEGEVVGDYSPEAPVWSGTMGQWQTHEGVDIAGAPGEAVVACGDGVVADVYSDRLWGNVIVIDHGDGYTSTCASLNTLELVRAGQAVSAGEVISAVGRSADCEADLGWHIHFALTLDGAPVDFADLAGRP